jgi:CHAT domain/WD domain, G-beta repeat
VRELSYLDFDVLFERASKGAYRARVLNAPAGQTSAVEFTVPFSQVELENFLLRIGRPRVSVRRVDEPETAAAKKFGGQLFRALFHDELQVSLFRSISEATAKAAGLRIRLHLSDTPELADLPWEFLYDQARNRFLCLSHRTPLVRYLEVPDPPRALPVRPPLQILVMVASPSDHPPLDVEQEWTKLRDALAPLERAGRVALERLEEATLAALRRRLRRDDWHVFHFIGHGGFDTRAQDGVLVLEDKAGKGRLVSGQELGVLLHDHDSLRLVVLNACEGARTDLTDPYAGTAQSLVQQGIPAVVAMQFEITDSAAIMLAQELYGAVADAYPLDAALAEARKAIYAEGNSVEWATPVLYLRAPDGRVFDLTATAPGDLSGTREAAAAPLAATPPTEQPQAATGPVTVPEEPAVAVPIAESKSSQIADDPRTGWSSTPVRTFEHHGGLRQRATPSINSVAISPDGRRLATGSSDNRARIWNATTGELWHTFTHEDLVNAVAFSREGRWLISGSSDATARVWDVATGELRRTYNNTNGVVSLALSAEDLLAIGSWDGTVRVWTVPTGGLYQTITHRGSVQGVALSHDGHWLATAADDETARIWSATTGTLRRTLTHEGLGSSIAFSQDGRWLITGGSDHTVRVWSMETGELQRILPQETSVSSVAQSSDGRWLVIVSSEKKAMVWDVEAGELRHTFEEEVDSVAFSQDGRWLATSRGDNKATLWALQQPVPPPKWTFRNGLSALEGLRLILGCSRP